MRIPPSSVILSWPTPNYTDPPTRGPALVVINIVFTLFLLIAVSGRFYARRCIQRSFGADDWMMIPACVFNIGLSAVVILADLRFGWDRHIWDIAPSMYQNANLMAFVAKFMFVFASTCTRLSLLFFYCRLISDSGIRWFKWLLHASVAWTTSVCIVFTSLTIWLCVPVQCYWVFPPMENCHCLDEGKVLVGTGVANCLTDALVTLLPVPVSSLDLTAMRFVPFPITADAYIPSKLVMRLQMPLKQRIGVCVLLCLGVVVTIAGAVRTYYSWKGLMESWDEPWWTYLLWVAAAVEIDLATICACAPAWKGLIQQRLLPALWRRRKTARSLRIWVSTSFGVKRSYLDSLSTSSPL